MTDETTDNIDLSEYEGQYVAIRKGRIVASGPSQEEVEQEAHPKSVIARVASSDPPETLDMEVADDD